MAENKTNNRTQKKRFRFGKNEHVWKFARIGGVNRVSLESGRDLVELESLDQKLWTALSCPVYGLEIDERTLELIDKNHDGRIRVPEILAAVKWAVASVKNPDDYLKSNEVLPLSAINDSTPEGKLLLDSARRILSNLGKPDATELSVAETSNTAAIFADTQFNGDGVITEESSSDESLKKIINDIIKCIGAADDLSGKQGVTQEQIDEFYRQCSAFSEWQGKAEADTSLILPYGEMTADAFEAFTRVKAKIEDYFLRCRLAEFDEESAVVLNALHGTYEAIKTKDIAASMGDISDLPIVKIEPGKALSLVKGVNPAWEEALSNFDKLVVQPKLSGKKSLSEEEWKQLASNFDAYQTWLAEKDGNAVESLGLESIRKLLAGDTQEELSRLIAQDLELAEDTKNIMLVDQLARYYRDLYTLLNNYVTFCDFYSPDMEAIFQSGHLYIDQRRCDLCIRVNDMPKHDMMARSSGICLIYCNCTLRNQTEEKMTIVVALTDGDFDNIEVGRNALFYDKQGRDWDATIIKVLENPISIRQAFWSPYRRMAKFISTQIEKFAASKDKQVEESTLSKVEASGKQIEATSSGTAAAPVAPPPPFDIAKFVGIFAAISLALGAIGSVIVSILTGFLSLTWWKMPLAILGVMLCISGPSMLLAWLKLRKRNLTPVLDANGWAINARVSINIIFGKTLTSLASLPDNSRLNLKDPFAKKRNPFIPIIIALIIAALCALFLLWRFGYVQLPFTGA